MVITDDTILLIVVSSTYHVHIFLAAKFSDNGHNNQFSNSYCGHNNLYSSPNMVRVIKSRRMTWAGHVAHTGEERGCIVSWWGNRRKRDHWGDLGIDGWIILGCISRKWDVGIWTGPG
jgi:hypothetical protein